ncbi:MAG: PadR family transcriptional regulator [Calditrichia bacterium]
MSPYDLTKMQGMFELVKISVPAVYKNVKRLENGGYLQSETQKTGNMPEKKVYSLTEKGDARFRELLLACLTNPINFFFDFNVSLLFVNSVDRATGARLISVAKSQLEMRKSYLANQVEKFQHMPFPIVNLGKQQLKLSEVLLQWLDEFEREFLAQK